MNNHNLSSTTLALLKFSKTNNDFHWKNVRDKCLAELYHYDMTIQDVMLIVMRSAKEVISEKRFETFYGGDIFIECFYSSIKPSLHKNINSMNGIDLMNEYLTNILKDCFRFSRTDWINNESTKPSNSIDRDKLLIMKSKLISLVEAIKQPDRLKYMRYKHDA